MLQLREIRDELRDATTEPASVTSATTSGQITWCAAAITAVAHTITAAPAPPMIRMKRIIPSMTPAPSMPGWIDHAVPRVAAEHTRAARKMRIVRFTPAIYHA
jgi:hypothetical protein